MFEVVKDLTSFAEVVWEQGEDILVDNVDGVVGKPDSTDSRVPGRILGCQEVYGQCGADPYIRPRKLKLNLVFQYVPIKR